jgi:hypothetical protein
LPFFSGPSGVFQPDSWVLAICNLLWVNLHRHRLQRSRLGQVCTDLCFHRGIATQPGLLTGERCSPQSGAVSSAQRATSTLFLVDGMTFGTWAALIPSFQQKFSLSAGQLSWVLFGLVLGALISMPLAGQVIARCIPCAL